MVTPPIFCAGYSATRSATASAHLPPKYPSCRGVTQDFAKSVSGQHGQPKYLSRCAVVIGKPTKELNGTSLAMLGMRHGSCRKPKRSVNEPRSPSMSAFDPGWIIATHVLAPPNLAAPTQRTCNADIDKFRSRLHGGALQRVRRAPRTSCRFL